MKLPGFLSSSARRVLGVDIGTISIKVAEVAVGGKAPALLNYGILDSQDSLARAGGAMQTSALKLFEEDIVEFLKLVLGRVKPATTTAYASLPSAAIFTTLLSFPEMSDEELAKAVSFKAREYIPIPISEAALDWMKVGTSEDSKGAKTMQVFLISVPQEVVRKYQRIFSAAGLTLATLEVESLSLTRALTAGDPTPTFILDIGSRTTSVLVAEGANLLWSSQTDFAGSSLTAGIAQSLNVNPVRAEELKKERGILNSGINRELSTIMLPFLDAILNEVRRAEFNYRSQFPQSKKIERIIVTGGGANLPGLIKFVEDQMNLPTVKAAPLSRFTVPAGLAPLANDLNPRLAVALGLTLR